MEKDIIVQKFGGSSVENTEKLKLVSEHIIKEYREGNKVIVVVSAQGKTTDKLIQEEQEITNNPIAREHDVLVSTGEQITIAKLAIMLNSMGYKAISFTGWQIPIVTDGNFKDAKIKYINSDKIKKYLNDGYIVIIAGFQGIDEENNITTLGRGGSDTTAVALAAALSAARCDIYTDVDGVFELDPRKNPNVKKYKTISYSTMIEMAQNGAKVLHDRCVKIGEQFKVPVYVKSTFEKLSKGTLVSDKEDCFY